MQCIKVIEADLLKACKKTAQIRGQMLTGIDWFRVLASNIVKSILLKKNIVIGRKLWTADKDNEQLET